MPVYHGTTQIGKMYHGTQEVQIGGTETVATPAGPGGGGGTPSTSLNYYWGGRITPSFYQTNYGSADTSSAPWSGNDGKVPAGSSNWDLFEKHQTSQSGTTIGKRVSSIQWGNGNVGTAWPAIGAKNASNSFYGGVDQYCRNRFAFSQFDWGMTGANITDILNNTAAAKSHLGTFFTDMKTAGRPMFFRPFWEMNGNWYAWGIQVASTSHGNAPELGSTLATRQANYKTMWRNMWQICADVMGGFAAGSGSGTHTGNVSFCWCPNIWVSGSGATVDPTNYFPGSQYVDWLCFDGYATSTTTYQSPATLYNTTYQIFESLDSTKPFGICEFGIAQNTPSPYKEGWFADFFDNWLPAHPRIKYFNYFNDQGTNNDNPFIEIGRAGNPDGPRKVWADRIMQDRFKGGPATSATFPSGSKVPIP